MTCNYWAGFFGKLPTQRDFVYRGLSWDARDALDHWLSNRVIASQQDPWPSEPLTKWISLPASAQPLALAAIASADAVGRAYPLAALAAIPVEIAEAWQARAVQGLKAAAAGEIDADDLLAAITPSFG